MVGLRSSVYMVWPYMLSNNYISYYPCQFCQFIVENGNEMRMLIISRHWSVVSECIAMVRHWSLVSECITMVRH